MSAKGKTLSVMMSALVCGASLAAWAQPNPGPAVNAAPPQTPQNTSANPFGEMDKLLAELSGASLDLRKFMSAPNRSDVQECRAKFADKDLTAAVLPNEMESALANLHQCRAYVEKDALACNDLDRYKFKDVRSGLGEKCRKQSSKIAFAHSIIAHAPDAMERCSEWAKNGGAPSAEAVRSVCALIVSRADAHTIAPQIAALMKFSPGEAAAVESRIGELKGEEMACTSGAALRQDKVDGESCPAFVAYRKALEAKNASVCKTNSLCRMLMSRAGNCDALENSVQETFCKVRALEKSVAHQTSGELREQAFGQKKANVDMLISRLDGLVKGFEPKSSAKYKSHKDRFAALRDEVQKSMLRFHSKGAGNTPANGAAQPDESDEK